MKEITRTIQIQVTRIYRECPEENLKYLLPAESEKMSILERLGSDDQVLVEVKDFIREE